MQNTGFTLVELIAVVLLLSIVSVFALGSLSSQNNIIARGFFDDTVSAVRFAQKLSISTGCDVQVTISSSGYQLFQRANSAPPSLIECGSGTLTDTVDKPSNRAEAYSNFDITQGYSLSPVGSIVFNARGELGSTNNFTYTLSNGTDSYSFTVYGMTGLVDVN